MMSRSGRNHFRALLAPAAGVVLLLLLRVRGHTVFQIENLLLLLHWVPLLALLEALRRRGGELTPGGTHSASRRLYLGCLCGVMTLFIFSSIVRHRWFYFLQWLPLPPGAQWLACTAWWFVLLTALLLPLVLLRPRRASTVLWIILIAGQTLAAIALFKATDGVFIGRDDHPSFVFRFWQLNETFPGLRAYNPWWNGGVSDIHPLVSGAIPPWLLSWPLMRFFPVDQVYTAGFALLFIVFVPFMAAVSVRALRGSPAAQAAAAIMSLGVSQHYYLWLMNYGTIGACLTAAMIMPAAALLYRVVVMRRADAPSVIGMALSLTVMCFYAPAILTVLPLGISFLIQWRRWRPRTRALLAVCAAAALLLHAGSLLELFSDVDVGGMADRSRSAFLPTARVRLWSLEYIEDGYSFILAHLREGHPILLFLGLAAIPFTTHRKLRSWYLPPLLWLAWLCGWGRFHMPHMQLSRMAIPMLFLAVIPAAIHVGDVLKAHRIRWALWRAALIALLALTALNNLRMYQRRGRARYHVFTQTARSMADWISAETPPLGRVMFAGETVHAYDGGHVAVFPVLTDREMMASDYYHFDPGATEYEYPPRPFRESLEGWLLFMDMYNVCAVFTYHDRWKTFFERHPDVFIPAVEWEPDGWRRTYRVARECNGRIWRGRGRADAHFNRIEIIAEPGQDEVVLGYNWADGLHSDSPAEIFPFETGYGPVLIGVRPNGQTRVSIRYHGSAFKRLKAHGLLRP